MKATVLLASTLLAMSALNATEPRATLRSLRNNTRPLLIFTPGLADPRIREQAAFFAHESAGLRERQVQVFLVADGPANFPGADPTVWRGALADSPASLRKRFHIAPDAFTIILVGKDGGEKLRTEQPIPYARLRDTIDAMPMRQEEMQPR